MLRIDTSQQLALVPAERLAVIPVAGAGFSARRLRGQDRAEAIGIAEYLEVDRRVDHREPRLMGEQLSHADRVLAALRELGPVAGDAFVEFEEPATVSDRHRR